MDRLKQHAIEFDRSATKDKKDVLHAHKHTKVAIHKDPEEAVDKWYLQQCSVKVKVQGIKITAAAEKLAHHMGIECRVSIGWLWWF